jgi:hypothetical protein
MCLSSSLALDKEVEGAPMLPPEVLGIASVRLVDDPLIAKVESAI